MDSSSRNAICGYGGRTLPRRRDAMRIWAAAALASWIALWLMVYRGKRRQRKASQQISDAAGRAPEAPEATSCSAVAVGSDVEGSAGADPVPNGSRGGEDR